MLKYKSKNAKKLEKKLNIRGWVIDEQSGDEDIDVLVEYPENDNIGAYVKDTADLENYINSISVFDIKKFV